MSDGEAARLELALGAVREAAHATRAVTASWADDAQGRERDAHTKDDASPVTVADLAAQVLMARIIGRTAPRRAEETAAPLDAPGGEALAAALLSVVRARWPDASPRDLRELLEGPPAPDPRSPHWVMDPVDGTAGFLRGMQYAICLAFLEGGLPTLGLLGCPQLGPQGTPDLAAACPPGRVFVARRGAGALEVELGGDERCRIRVASWRGGPVRVGVPWEPRYTNPEAVAAWFRRAGLSHEPVRVDSQAKYALVARGDIHAYLRIPLDEERRENVWDHAAGFVVATEAGAWVTDVEGRQLDFGRGARLEANRGILCATPAVHAALLAAR